MASGDLHVYSLIGLLVILSVACLSSVHINPFNFINTITSDPCKPGTDLIIVVHSAISHHYAHRRVMLRSSWLNQAQLSSRLGLGLKVIFLLGASVDPVEQKYAEYEAEMYRDIVQYSFIDSYQNNTYKAMSYLRWVSENCAESSLLMKIDDDLLLKESRFIALHVMIWRLMENKSPLYAGRLMKQYATPNRDEESKWYTSYAVYPHEFYPIWYQGLVYFLSPSLAADLFRVALDTPYMFMDDVFIGISVDKLSGRINTSRVNLEGLSQFKLKFKAESAWIKVWEYNSSPLYHVPNASQFWLWQTESRCIVL